MGRVTFTDRLRSCFFSLSQQERMRDHKKVPYNVMIGFLALNAFTWLSLGIQNRILGYKVNDQSYQDYSYVSNSCFSLSLINVTCIIGLVITRFLGEKLCNKASCEVFLQRQAQTKREYTANQSTIRNSKNIPLFYLINTIFYYSVSLHHLHVVKKIPGQIGLNNAARIMASYSFLFGTVFTLSFSAVVISSCFKNNESPPETRV